MADNEILKKLKAQYFLLDRNFDALLASAKTEGEKQQLRDSYQTARDNFRKAQNAVFDQNDAQVKSLTTQFEATQKELEKMVADLGKISDFIAKLATAVKIGSKLVALATGV